MTIVADHPARTRHDRTLLATIDRRELVRLLYGDITTSDQQVALEQVAEESGVDVDTIRPATGEPDEDPRTAMPAALLDDEDAVDHDEPRDPTDDELSELDTDLDDLTQAEAYDHLVVTYMADVAELLDLPAAAAEKRVRSWRIPPHDDILHVLHDARRRTGVQR